MAYQIYNYDGTLFATINDGTLNTSSSLTLIGKNWAGYGAYLDQNMLYLMQNFSSTTAPSAPVTGQLFWNSGTGRLAIYNGTVWKTFSAAATASAAPATGNVTGDLWYNTSAQVLNVYNGTTWLAVGPSVTNGTGAQTTTITDTLSGVHSVIELLVGTNIVGIISQDAFSPATPIPGFNNIQAGLNLSGNIGGGGTAAGTVTSWLSVLGNVVSTGNISAVGNVTGQYLIGNGAFITGSIGNGSGNVNAANGTFSGNVTAGNVSVTGNITGNVIIGNTGQFTGVVTAGGFSTAGNVTAGNVIIGRVFANGGYGTAGQILTSNGPGSSAYWATAAAGYGNSDVSNYLTNNTVEIKSLGVGTAGSGTTGEIRATNNITAFFSSDARYKTNVKPIESAVAKVVAIGGKTFDWSPEYIAEHGGADGYFVSESDYGVIAQDVASVFPAAVRTREDGTLAVDYARLSALAFAAIAELAAEIKQLKGE